MQTLIETIIGGLIVALIVGLTALAFKNPLEYKNLSKIVDKYLMQIFIFILGLSFGFFKTLIFLFNNSKKFTEENDITIIREVINHADKISNIFILIIVALILFSLYLIALEKIPQIIKKNKN